MRLRLIPYEEREACLNMALDWVLFQEILEGELPCLRFYGFSPPAVTLGKFQKRVPRGLESYPVAVRPTGGRAVLHEGDLVFSLTGWHTDGPFAGGVLDTYKHTAEILARAARKLGLAVELERGKAQPYRDMCFESTSRYELTLNGVKKVGIAQARDQGAFLEQGSIQLPVDSEAYMAEITRVFEEDGFCIEEKGFSPWELKRAQRAQREFRYESSGSNTGQVRVPAFPRETPGENTGQTHDTMGMGSGEAGENRGQRGHSHG